MACFQGGGGGESSLNKTLLSHVLTYPGHVPMTKASYTVTHRSYVGWLCVGTVHSVLVPLKYISLIVLALLYEPVCLYVHVVYVL